MTAISILNGEQPIPVSIRNGTFVQVPQRDEALLEISQADGVVIFDLRGSMVTDHSMSTWRGFGRYQAHLAKIKVRWHYGQAKVWVARRVLTQMRRLNVRWPEAS